MGSWSQSWRQESGKALQDADLSATRPMAATERSTYFKATRMHAADPAAAGCTKHTLTHVEPLVHQALPSDTRYSLFHGHKNDFTYKNLAYDQFVDVHNCHHDVIQS